MKNWEKMETINDNWTVFTLHQRRHRIDPSPAYQRGPVWNTAKQQLLIDSILRGYDMPKVYLRKLLDSKYDHEVIDGQQRLRALWAFLDGEYSIGRASEDLPGDLVGMRFSDLPQNAQDTVGLFKVTIAEVRDASEIAVRELFLRLQEGVSLNAAEKRNAMPGPVRDFVHNLATTHPLFPSLGIDNKRFAWQELGAIALRLEQAEGPTDLKGANLMSMYEDRSFKPNGEVAKRCLSTLDYFAKVARLGPGDIKTRWGFVDLYLALRILLSERDMDGKEAEILASHMELESERLQAAGALDEVLAGDANLEGPPDQARIDLVSYVSAFVREGATRSNVATRHHVYMRRLRSSLFGDVIGVTERATEQ